MIYIIKIRNLNFTFFTNTTPILRIFSLALGFPVDTVIQKTRNAISQEVGLDKRDFATPVLYVRAKDGIILSGL